MCKVNLHAIKENVAWLRDVLFVLFFFWKIFMVSILRGTTCIMRHQPEARYVPSCCTLIFIYLFFIRLFMASEEKRGGVSSAPFPSRFCVIFFFRIFLHFFFWTNTSECVPFSLEIWISRHSKCSVARFLLKFEFPALSCSVVELKNNFKIANHFSCQFSFGEKNYFFFHFQFFFFKFPAFFFLQRCQFGQ